MTAPLIPGRTIALRPKAAGRAIATTAIEVVKLPRTCPPRASLQVLRSTQLSPRQSAPTATKKTEAIPSWLPGTG